MYETSPISVRNGKSVVLSEMALLFIHSRKPRLFHFLMPCLVGSLGMRRAANNRRRFSFGSSVNSMSSQKNTPGNESCRQSLKNGFPHIHMGTGGTGAAAIDRELNPTRADSISSFKLTASINAQPFFYQKMKRRGSKKNRQAPESFIGAPAPTAVFELCFSRDIVLGCFAKWMSLSDLLSLLRCNKRLYSFGLHYWPVLRECQYLYGGAHKVTNLWIKHAVKSGNTEAVKWIMDRALQEYLKKSPHRTRADKTGEALVLCIPRALKTAFKMENAEMIDSVLNWRIQNLLPIMKTDLTHQLYHLFNYCGTKEALHVLLPEIMQRVAYAGHTTFVRRFFEKYCTGFTFPHDVALFRDGYSAPISILELKEQTELIESLVRACIIHGDTDSYAYFEPIAAAVWDTKPLDTHNYWTKSLDRVYEERFHALLEMGVSTTFIPILLKVVPYRDEWNRAKDWMRWVCCNPNPIMLDYVRNTFSEGLWLECFEHIKTDYRNKEAALRDQCCGILRDGPSKKTLKTIGLLTNRLKYLERILTNAPFDLDWDDMDSYRGSPMLTLNW
jgi:hypothetical protein